MEISLAEVPSPIPLRVDEHGVMRIGQTRVRLDTAITAWQQGESPEQIVENFDALDLADVYTVIGYYLYHRAEVDEYIARNQQESARLRAKHEQHFSSAGIRARLLARRTARSNTE
jgi:uncharacterized protein (DUF433 family)